MRSGSSPFVTDSGSACRATSIDDRDASFEMAASYKALATDMEWFGQRSYKREQKLKAFD